MYIDNMKTKTYGTTFKSLAMKIIVQFEWKMKILTDDHNHTVNIWILSHHATHNFNNLNNCWEQKEDLNSHISIAPHNVSMTGIHLFQYSLV